MQHWTPEQWAIFTATVAIGIATAAVLVLAGRRYVPPSLSLPDPARVPRPSIVMTERRARNFAAEWRAAYDTPAVERTQPLPVIVGAGGVENWVDPTMADFTDPGIGALSSIQQMVIDPTLRTSAELHAEESAWINAYADLSGQMPETDAAAETMRIALEPVLRKARLWCVRAGEGGAGRRGLTDWRINTATGEYAMLTTADLAPYARALLAS
jgi:hypothetical protein